jgi:uncharacterized cupredoxin-like copper-binding protein
MSDPNQGPTTRTAPRLRAVRRRAGRAALPLLVVSATWLAGCGSDDAGAGSTSELSPEDVSQTVEFTATEYEFGADASTTIEAGEVVRFRLTNVGGLDHEMRVLDANGRMIDQIQRLAPGESGEVLLSFESAGQYQLICDIDDHLTRGQQAIFSVNEPVND